MTDAVTGLRVEDSTSVGTRISWGAILAGTFLALGLYFLFATLGGAVGLSTTDRTNPTTLHNGAVAWAFLTTIVALFVGGLATSLFTAGENKTEAMMSGIIMWALLVVMLLVLGSLGIRAGFNALQATGNNPQTASTQSWETAARDAGVPAEQIEDWRRKQRANADTTGPDSRNQHAALDAATRISWYAFAGTWLSMLAAAAGAFVGAGPTFRIVAAPEPLVRNGTLPHSPASPAYSRT